MDSIDIVIYNSHSLKSKAICFIFWLYNKQIKFVSLEKIGEYQLIHKNLLVIDYVGPEFFGGIIISVIKDDRIVKINACECGNLEKKNVKSIWKMLFPDREIPYLFTVLREKPIDHIDFLLHLKKSETNFESWMQYISNIQNIFGDKFMIDVINNLKMIIHEINDEYKIIAYLNVDNFKSSIAREILKIYPFLEIVCVCYVESETDKCARLFSHCNKKILNITKTGNFMRMGNSDTLNFKIMSDHGFMQILMDSKKEQIKMAEKEIKCAVLKITKLESEWLKIKFLNLIKNIFNDCPFIIFESLSDMLDISEKYDQIKINKEYNIIYNERTITDPLKYINYNAYNLKTMMTFVTDKNIFELFE